VGGGTMRRKAADMTTIKSYYSKRLAILLATWIALGGSLVYASVEYSPWWIVGLLALQIVLGVTIIRWRCPKCDHAVLHPAVNLFGTKIRYWSCWVPNECGNCKLNFHETTSPETSKINAI